LARASDVAALTSRARRGATVDELPGDDAVKDVGARLDGENLVVELDVAALAGVEALYLDLHLSLPCSRRQSRRPRASPRRQQHRLPARLRSPRLPRRWGAPGSRGPRRRRPGLPQARALLLPSALRGFPPGKRRHRAAEAGSHG